MKPPSEMTVHELVQEMLDTAGQFKEQWSHPDIEVCADLLTEAAERLELAADGQGVGPTKLERQA